MRWVSGVVRRASAAAARAKDFLLNYAYLMTLGAALLVVVASALYTNQLRQETELQAAADAPEIEETPAPTLEPLPTAVPLATMAPLQLASAVKLGGTTVRPVRGAALRGFDLSAPVYWEAISCVSVHAGLDLAGEAGEDVLCAMDGTVREAVRDELWGWRVTVEQTDGQTAVYAGLANSLVQTEQNVTRGQPLGALIDAIPCEAELGAHLHMELRRDGQPQNPASILPDAR